MSSPIHFTFETKIKKWPLLKGSKLLDSEPRTEVSRELCVWEMEGRCVVSGRDPRNHEERR